MKNLMQELADQAAIDRNPFAKNQNRKFFVIAAPSGAGKSTLVSMLLKILHLVFVITHTTRKLRPGELQGVTYYSVNDKKFDSMIANNEFAEYEPVYSKTRYGTSYRAIADAISGGHDAITDVDVNGAIALKILFPNNVHTIFLQPQSPDQIKQQLLVRASENKGGDGNLQERLDRFDYEMGQKEKFDSVVTSVAGDPNHALKCVTEIIRQQIANNHAFVC